jgi:hypothetical protein
MDVNEHERLSNITLKTQINVNEQRFYYCSMLHSDSRLFNNENNSYPQMSVKHQASSWEVHYLLPSL